LPERSLKRRLLHGLFWLTAAKIIGQAITWTITIYVVRILSPNDYGLMAMAGVYLGLIILFNEVGLSAAVIQKRDLDQEDISNICWAVLFVNLVLYALSFLSAPLVATFYEEPRVTQVIRLLSVVLIIRSLGLVSNNLLTRELIFNKQSQAELIGNVSGAVTTLLLARHGAGVWSLVYGQILTELVRNALFFFFHPWRPVFSFSFVKAKKLIDFGFKVVLARLFWYLSANIDLLIAGKILGKTQLGYYAIAAKFAFIPLDKAGFTISQMAFPAFAKVQNDPVLLRRYYLKIVNFVAFASFPVCCGIALIAESAVPLFLSEKWLPAILPLQILGMVTAFRALHVVTSQLEMAIGRPAITMRNYMIIAIVLAVSFFIGSFHGLKGLAYAWLVFPVASMITTSITLRIIGLSLAEYVKELRHPILGTGFMALTVLSGQEWLLANHGLVAHVAASSTLGVASYLMYYVLFNRRMFTEAKALLKS